MRRQFLRVAAPPRCLYSLTSDLRCTDDLDLQAAEVGARHETLLWCVFRHSAVCISEICGSGLSSTNSSCRARRTWTVAAGSTLIVLPALLTAGFHACRKQHRPYVMQNSGGTMFISDFGPGEAKLGVVLCWLCGSVFWKSPSAALCCAAWNLWVQSKAAAPSPQKSLGEFTIG